MREPERHASVIFALLLLIPSCRVVDVACGNTDVTCNVSLGLLRLWFAKSITSYSIPSLGISGTIQGNQITLVSDTLTAFTPQIAAFSTTGQSVSISGVPQISGVSSNTYSTNLIYTVTAHDGSTQDYTVTLVAPRTYGGSSLSIWLKAESLSLSDGAAVSAWNDFSGHNNNFTQPTATQRPTFRTNQINGVPSVQFRQSTSQIMNIVGGGTGLYATNSGSTFVVMNFIQGNPAGTAILLLEGAGGRELLTGFPNGELNPCRNGTGCWTPSNIPLPKAFTAIAGIQVLTSSYAEYWNGDLKGSVSAGILGYGGAAPGTANISNGNLDADIAEVLFFNTALSQNETDKVFCYLRAKYNLTAVTTSCGT